MRPAAIVLALAVLAVAAASVEGAREPKGKVLDVPERPVWPSSYEVSYTISLPYLSSLQPNGLKYPVHVWWDADTKRLRTSFYYGLDDVYVLPGSIYSVFPRINVKACTVVNTTVGPTLGEEGPGDAPPPLPTITNEWDYAGTARLPGKPATHVWQRTERWFDKVNTYAFHVSQADSRPIQLFMLGVNLMTGSHYDQYTVEFTVWVPHLRNEAGAFTPPTLCKNATPPSASTGLTADAATTTAAAFQALSVLPSAIVPGPAESANSRRGQGVEGALRAAKNLVSGWIARAQGAAADGSSLRADANTDVLQANLRFIEQWNAQQDAGAAVTGGVAAANGAPKDGFRLAANKFVAVTDEAWQAVSLGLKAGSSRPAGSPNRLGASLGTFQRKLRDDQLPESVDWRGTGADGPVKDQASCGSCWAFATAGAMTGAWFLATGQSLSLSEQQIVDCSWDYEVNGCGGGWVEPALTYINDIKGAALEADYPYLGQNGFCKHNTTAKAAFFSGFQSVPEGDEKALMEAVATHGPVAISFDAVHPTFKYYSEGVYYRADCGNDADHLNHAVTLVGYGTTANGTDYWLLRNSWSNFWGENGYFKMARKGNDCGVTVDAVVAVVDKKAAAKALERHPGGEAAVAAARARALGTSRQQAAQS